MGAGPSDRDAARALGRSAESATAASLERSGCRVLARNWRGGGGELDLVVARADKLRFVEVKARSANLDYEPIHPGQVRRLRCAAEAWMAAQPSAWWSEACFALAVVDVDGRIDWKDDPF